VIHNSQLLSRCGRLASAALVVALFACDGRPSGVSSHTWDKPCDHCISGVENFAKVSPALWRGAQPTAEGFRSLEAAGVKTVINLRGRHDDLPLLGGTNLKYVRSFARAWDPEEAELAEVLKVIADRDNWPVFVHCAQGRDRTGYVVATYRMFVDGWSADDAIREMYDFRFNTIWFRNLGFLRGLNIDKMRGLVALAQ